MSVSLEQERVMEYPLWNARFSVGNGMNPAAKLAGAGKRAGDKGGGIKKQNSKTNLSVEERVF